MNSSNNKIYMARTLVSILSGRDKYTGLHSQNVANLMYQLADSMGLYAEDKEKAYIAGLVHDIGKMKLPSYILTKPGALTVEEYDIIKSHSELGVRLLSKFDEFASILDAIRHHHERFDGNGYPDGKQGEAIPLLSRMLAVCDTFDAMTTKRCYRPPHTWKEALAEIKLYAGTQFDPVISQQFLSMMCPTICKEKRIM